MDIITGTKINQLLMFTYYPIMTPLVKVAFK